MVAVPPLDRFESSHNIYPWGTLMHGDYHVLGKRRCGRGHRLTVEKLGGGGQFIRLQMAASELGISTDSLDPVLNLAEEQKRFTIADRKRVQTVEWVSYAMIRKKNTGKRNKCGTADALVKMEALEKDSASVTHLLCITMLKKVMGPTAAVKEIQRCCDRDGIDTPWNARLFTRNDGLDHGLSSGSSDLHPSRSIVVNPHTNKRYNSMEKSVEEDDVQLCSMKHLPNEVWHNIHRFLSPVSRWRLSMVNTQTRLPLQEKQRQYDRIWLTILKGELWVQKIRDQGLDLALISCDFDQLLSETPQDDRKPYLIMSIIQHPGDSDHLSPPISKIIVHGDDFLSDLRSKNISLPRLEVDFTEFTLNIKDVLDPNHIVNVPDMSPILFSIPKLLYYSDSTKLYPTRPHGFPGIRITLGGSQPLEQYTVCGENLINENHHSNHTGLKEFFEGLRSFETVRRIGTYYECSCCIDFVRAL